MHSLWFEVLCRSHYHPDSQTQLLSRDRVISIYKEVYIPSIYSIRMKNSIKKDG